MGVRVARNATLAGAVVVIDAFVRGSPEGLDDQISADG